MKVTGMSLRALIVGAALTAVAALAPSTPVFAQAAKQQQPSAKLQKPLHDAQEDLKNKKYSEAIAKLKEAEGIGGKTPYDQFLINEFLAFAYIRTNNYPEAARALEAQLDSGLTPEGQVAQKTKELAQIHYQLKNYDKAIEFGTRAIKGGFADDQIKTLVGQSYYLKGDWKGTIKFEQAQVDSQVKAGQTPTNESLMLIYSSCQKLQDEACVTRAMEQLVTYYPKPDAWAALLYAVRKETSSNETDLLQTYRLMFDTDVLKDPGDYTEMAELLLDSGSPGEAQRVLQRGLDKGVFADQRTKERAQRLLESAKKRAATDQPGLPKLEAEANAASTGQKNVAIGTGYFGYGENDKAIAQLSKGLSKGSVKSEADARLMLGIAQLKGGHKDEAIKTFREVKGDPALERIANLWVLHAKQA